MRWLVLWLAACPKPVPDHLRVDPPAEAEVQRPISDRGSAIAWVVGADPLVRSPTLPELSVLESVEGVAPLIDFVQAVRRLEQGEGQVERSMQQVEDGHRGTEAVALARGYRLRVVENLLANLATASDERDRAILPLLTPLQVSADDPTLNRPALDWLAGEGASEPSVRAYAERWVLSAWLDRPDVRVQAPAQALRADMYDGLARTPIASLVLARDAGAKGDVGPGLAKLERATTLALQQAAADRDKEQAAWAATKRSLVEELGEDPVGALLEQAFAELAPLGGEDAAVGGALLAHAARRWRDTCGDPPCVGIERVEAMGVARRWSPELDRMGALWQVVALKEALDTMDVAHDTVMYPTGAVGLVDAVLGTGGGPLEDQVLRKRRPDAGVWLALGRAVGEEGVTEWSGARAALGAHLKQHAEAARTLVGDGEQAALLDRITSRAIP